MSETKYKLKRRRRTEVLTLPGFRVRDLEKGRSRCDPLEKVGVSQVILTIWLLRGKYRGRDWRGNSKFTDCLDLEVE